MRPLYIFDLDGTLALIEHRLHYIQRPSLACTDCSGKNRESCEQCAGLDAGFKPDWRAFFAACGKDGPNLPVVRTMKALLRSEAEVWIWSGRSAECETITKEWLKENCGNWTFGGTVGATIRGKQFSALRMRKAGDRRDDVVVKAEWLAEIDHIDRKRLVAVFDDRARVVKMWRDAGIACFQVAPGEF